MIINILFKGRCPVKKYTMFNFSSHTHLTALIDVKAIFSTQALKLASSCSVSAQSAGGAAIFFPLFFPDVKSYLLHLQLICMASPPHLWLVDGSRRATMLCWTVLYVCVVLCECLRVHAVCAHHRGLCC